MLNDIIKGALDDVSLYTEVRSHVNTGQEVGFVAGNLVKNSKSSTSGVCARVYKNGVYGLASACEYNEESIKSVINAAKENALFLDKRVNKGKPDLYDSPKASYIEKHDVIETSQKEFLDYAKILDDYIKEKYKNLLSRTVMVNFDSIERLLYVSTGSVAHTISPRTTVMISMAAEARDGTNVELYDVIKCEKGYFSEVLGDPSELYQKIDELYNNLMAKREGVFPKAGVCDCIIDSNISGMIAHEAIGHTVEADLVLAGSVAASKLGQKVADEKITITDFAYDAFGKEAPLPLYVDDEGTPCRDVVLIKDGVLNEYMNNRESALHFNMEPRGNARAFAFSDEPLIRMRNTAISPGKDKLSDMIASIDDGYYLISTLNGQADTTGEFMFSITMGYEIKKGKLGKAIRDTTISGVAFDTLKTVSMLSDEIGWSSSGYCGKKQLMPVSCGGPAIKCKINIGGR